MAAAPGAHNSGISPLRDSAPCLSSNNGYCLHGSLVEGRLSQGAAVLHVCFHRFSSFTRCRTVWDGADILPDWWFRI